MKHEQGVRQWALESLKTQQGTRKERLQKLLADLQRRPDSAALQAGSAQWLVARSRERTLMQEAVNLGYEPPEQVIVEMGLHLGLDLGFGL